VNRAVWLSPPGTSSVAHGAEVEKQQRKVASGDHAVAIDIGG
jgi:hypothetical protein